MAYTDNIDQPKWKNRVAWGAQGLLALAFLAAGSQKIIGTEPMLQMFAAIGLGPLFQYVTGSLEITGAVMLLIPATAFWGAALVSCIMVGAIYTHLAVIGGSFVPALMLLLLEEPEAAGLLARLEPGEVETVGRAMLSVAEATPESHSTACRHASGRARRGVR